MDRFPLYSGKNISRVRREILGASDVGSIGIARRVGTPPHIISFPDHVPETNSPPSIKMQDFFILILMWEQSVVCDYFVHSAIDIGIKGRRQKDYSELRHYRMRIKIAGVVRG